MQSRHRINNQYLYYRLPIPTRCHSVEAMPACRACSGMYCTPRGADPHEAHPPRALFATHIGHGVRPRAPNPTRVCRPHHEEWDHVTACLARKCYLPTPSVRTDRIDFAIRYLEHETSKLVDELIPEGRESDFPDSVKGKLRNVLQLEALLRNECKDLRQLAGVQTSPAIPNRARRPSGGARGPCGSGNGGW